MTFRLTKIDELTIGQHYHLDASDTCFFLVSIRLEKDLASVKQIN